MIYEYDPERGGTLIAPTIYHNYMERWEVPPTFTPRVKAFIAGTVLAIALAGIFFRAMHS